MRLDIRCHLLAGVVAIVLQSPLGRVSAQPSDSGGAAPGVRSPTAVPSEARTLEPAAQGPTPVSIPEGAEESQTLLPEEQLGGVEPKGEAARLEAAGLWLKARESFQRGDLKAALDQMRRAYTLAPEPKFLFSLGEISQELNHCRDAVDYYRSYVTALPLGKNAARAREGIRALSPRCPEPTPSGAPSAPQTRVGPDPRTAAREAPYWTPLRATGWSLLGAGLVSGGGALYFAWRGERLETQAEQRVTELDGTSAPAFDTASASNGEEQGRRANTVAWALGGASVLALGAGVTTLLLAASPDSKGKVAVRVGPGAAYARVRF